ncbi:MAG: glycerol-3-phosphate dehydrogenase [Pseudonocardiales bacterium]|nr:glycerol-3-phosphate dehydrogenase [Pseudonocardiales bacterium]
MSSAAVLGAGSWGTTFAKVLIDAGTDATLWARREHLAQEIRATRQNADYLPGVTLPPALQVTSSAADALAGADIVAMAVPSQQLRSNLAAWAPLIPPDAVIVSLMKGIELGSAKRMSEVIQEVLGVDPGRIAVVSGPNLAGEIARGQPTATVIGCTDDATARIVQEACGTPYFRPYTNDDVVGCELGGAVKNVIALACGMAHGMGLGDNTLASLITRGLTETARLALALGADPATLSGLAGLGDLVATCASPLSRNRTFGARLGRGETLAQAQEHARGQIAEGVSSCTSVLDLAARHGVDVPITQAVHRVCHEGMSARDMVHQLMTRAMKSE